MAMPMVYTPQYLLTAVPMFCMLRTWRDRRLGAGAGATLILVVLWLVLVSAAAAGVILRTWAPRPISAISLW